jgi:hypothetical protein
MILFKLTLPFGHREERPAGLNFNEFGKECSLLFGPKCRVMGDRTIKGTVFCQVRSQKFSIELKDVALTLTIRHIASGRASSDMG